MKRLGSAVFLAIFFLFLALPGFGFLWNLPYPADGAQTFEQWAEANIWFRDAFISLHGRLNQEVFGESGHPQVIMGEDGWFFFSETMDDFFRRETMSGSQIHALSDFLDGLSVALKAEGIGMTVLIAPNKNTIYPEKMTRHARQGKGESNLERVQVALAARSVNVLDAQALLLANKGQGFLYHKTDTHWNALGALIVYRELMGRIAHGSMNENSRHAYNGSAYEKYEDIIWREDAAFSGDLARLSLSVMYGGKHTETSLVPELERGYRVQGVMRSLSDMTIRTESDANDLRVLMLRDSFGDALFPYLANNVGQLTYARDMRVDVEDIARQGYMHVVIEVAERSLTGLLERLEMK